MTTFVKASCHCGLNTFQIPFNTASLPKSAAMCHCNICRHTTGQMSVIDVRVDGEPFSAESTEANRVPASLAHLTAYKSSSIATRYFCSKCSAHMFFRANAVPGSTEDGGHWSVFSGVLERIDGIVRVSSHIFVGDTLDGGIADHFRSVDRKVLPRRKTWKEDEPELPLGWRANEAPSVPETLPYHCHCRSVSFYLTRAKKTSDDPKVYWLVPGKEPTDPIRFISAHCLCNSCRLTSGGQIQSWTIVPNENVIDPQTSAPIDFVDPEKRPKGLKQYESSPGKHRESCGTCGATVFWWREMKDGEDAHIDVSVGLVDEAAAGGARAESWLAQYDNLIFKEFALSPTTAKVLEEGIKA